MAMTKGVIVEVVVVTVCCAGGMAVAAGGMAAAEAEARDTRGEIRIHARTPRLRLRAPSTPSDLVIPGFVMN